MHVGQVEHIRLGQSPETRKNIQLIGILFELFDVQARVDQRENLCPPRICNNCNFGLWIAHIEIMYERRLEQSIPKGLQADNYHSHSIHLAEKRLRISPD